MLSSRLTDVGKVVVMDQTAAADIVRDLASPVVPGNGGRGRSQGRLGLCGLSAA